MGTRALCSDGKRAHCEDGKFLKDCVRCINCYYCISSGSKARMQGTVTRDDAGPVDGHFTGFDQELPFAALVLGIPAYAMWAADVDGFHYEVRQDCATGDWSCFVGKINPGPQYGNPDWASDPIAGNAAGGANASVYGGYFDLPLGIVEDAHGDITITLLNNTCCRDENGDCISGTPDEDGQCNPLPG